MSNLVAKTSECIDHNLLMDEFKKYYPDIDPNTVDDELFENMLQNIMNEKYKKTCETQQKQTNIHQEQKNIINNNILMADELIPEMSIPTNLIYLKGRLNGNPINIMIDTGASSCFTYSSTIIKCGLENLIDKRATIMVEGAHGVKPTLGSIWFLEVELDISNGQEEQYVSIPITVGVNDDSEIIKAKDEVNDKIEKKIKKIKENKETSDKYKSYDTDLLEKEFEKMKNDCQKKKMDLILGINFLKSYRANIDFGTMTMTLNKSIQIKFK